MLRPSGWFGLAASVALTVIATTPALAAPGDLAYFKTYPEVQASANAAGFNAAAVQPDGKVVLAGFAYQASGLSNSDWVVARIDPLTGALDSSFGQSGVVKIPIDLVASGDDFANAVAIGPGGRILVAGGADAAGGGTDMAVVALTSGGERDSGFGPQGLRTAAFGSIDRARAVVVDGVGTVTIGGLGDSGFALARFGSNGEPDNSFDTDGQVVTLFGDVFSDEVAELILPGDNTVIAVGTAGRNSAGAEVALARYDSAGQVATSKVIAGPDIDEAIDGVLSGGRVVVASNARGSGGTPRTVTQAYDAASFDPVAGFGGPTFGDPSLYGGITGDGAGGFLAVGIGPFGGALDDMRLAFLGSTGTPVGTVFNYPSSADKQEFANAVVVTPAPPAPGTTAVVAGSSADVPAVAAAQTGDAPAPPPPAILEQADLAVTKTIHPDAKFLKENNGVAENAPVKLVIRVQNNGPYPTLSGVTVTDSFPPGMDARLPGNGEIAVYHAFQFGGREIRNRVPAMLGSCAVTPEPPSGRLRCELSALRQGEAFLIEVLIKPKVSTRRADLHNEADATSTPMDPNPTNNPGTLDIRVYRVTATFNPFKDLKSGAATEASGRVKSGSSPATGSRAAATSDPLARITKVQVAFLRPAKGAKASAARCAWLKPGGGGVRMIKPTRGVCDKPVWIRAKLRGTRWSLRVPKGLPAGRWVAYARATNKGGLTTGSFTAKQRNRLKLRVR